LNHLLDREIDLTGFDARYANDVTGAAAYPPAMLLKVVLFAYSMGIVSSRNIERACREHITFIALSGDSQPHSPPSPDSFPRWATTSPPSSAKSCSSATSKD